MKLVKICAVIFFVLIGLCMLSGSFVDAPKVEKAKNISPDNSGIGELQADTPLENASPSSKTDVEVNASSSSSPDRETVKDPRSYIDRQILADKVIDEKISFDIILKSKPSEIELRSLAKLIIDEHDDNFNRVFVVYYLPGMVIDNGGWAISHKRPGNPEIEFRILGLSKEAEANIETTSISREWNVFGRWIDKIEDSGLLTFYRQDGQMKLQIIYSDNSVGYRKVKPINVGGAAGFEEVGGNFKDEPPRWIITSDGSLQQMDYGSAFGQKYGRPLSRFLPKELVRYRQWKDISGSFEVFAEFVKQNTTEVTLNRNENGESIVVPIKQLSEIDKQWLRSERIRRSVDFKIAPE